MKKLHIYMLQKMLWLPVLILVFQVNVNAQTNPKPKVEEEVKDSLKITPGTTIAILENSTGWIKSNTGKWLSSLNRIPYDDNDYNNEYYTKFHLGTENFSQLRIMPLTIDKKQFYAIIVQQKKGYYKNPEDIKDEDWRYFTAADYFVVEKKEFKKLLQDSITYNQPYTASLYSHYAGTVPYTNVNQLGVRIAKDINKNIRTRHLYDTSVHTYFQMALKPVKDKRGKYLRFHIGINYAKTGNEPNDADYTFFDTQYYEVPYEKFRAFAAKLR